MIQKLKKQYEETKLWSESKNPRSAATENPGIRGATADTAAMDPNIMAQIGGAAAEDVPNDPG